jgi:hypothetical protein
VNRTESSQLTPSTGIELENADRRWLGFDPITALQNPCVTSVSPIQKLRVRVIV